jgi:hypothetical protein
LSSAALEARLLTQHDLGDGYLPQPAGLAEHGDVTVLGCPALNELGGEAATGGSLSFPRQAETAFTYRSSDTELSEELYSDAPAKLSTGTGRIFDAMTGCRTYQVLVGSTAVDVTVQEVPAPRLGDEQWAQLMTFTTGQRSTVVQQTAIRAGRVLLVLSGLPALVDAHLGKALAKATAAR